MGMNAGKMLVVVGIAITAIGVIVWSVGRFLPLGQLPGDIRVDRPGWSVRVPIVSSIVISIVLTIVLNLLLRWKR